MSTDFEKMMNDKMEQASVNDVLSDFDKEQIWDELSERIPKKKKKVIPVFLDTRSGCSNRHSYWFICHQHVL